MAQNLAECKTNISKILGEIALKAISTQLMFKINFHNLLFQSQKIRLFKYTCPRIQLFLFEIVSNLAFMQIPFFRLGLGKIKEVQYLLWPEKLLQLNIQIIKDILIFC